MFDDTRGKNGTPEIYCGAIFDSRIYKTRNIIRWNTGWLIGVPMGIHKDNHNPYMYLQVYIVMYIIYIYDMIIYMCVCACVYLYHYIQFYT